MPHHTHSRATTVTAVSAISLLALVSCGIFDAPEDQAPNLPPEVSEEPEPADGTPTPPEEPPEPSEEVLSQQGVSAAHPLAVQVGEDILDSGGNAVDAAIASAFAVSVVEPFASGIGGGGSAIIAGPEGDPVFHDYREVVNNDGEIPDSAAGIPGFVAGMGELHSQYGSMEWAELIEPAQQIAAEGFPVSEFLALRMGQNDGAAAIGDLEHFAPGGEPLPAGETLVQSELAETLSTLGQNGWEDFYTGGLADSLAEQADGIDSASLADYSVMTTDPSRGSFGDYEVLAAAPALPGPALIQMLQIAEANGIAEMDPTSAEYVDTLSQSWLTAEETVFSDLGDPAFVDVPVDDITDAESNAEIDLSSYTGTGIDDEGSATVASSEESAQRGANTTHISVVDDEGLTVSMTNTIMYFWGSGQMVDGYFLNNHLSRFEAIPTGANQPEPGKRTVTWSNPSIVLDGEGRPVLAIGSPGGHQILNILGTVLVQWGLQGRSLEDAVETARFRASEDTLFLEEGHPEETISALENLGWSTEVWPREQSSFGSVQPLEINYDDDALSSTDDPRREGAHAILD